MALPLVTIGGTLCDASLWTPFLHALGRPATCAVAGCRADGREAVASTMDGYGAELLDGLPARFILVGFSLGGLIALEMLAQAPGRLAGVAVICAGGGAEKADVAAQRRKDEARAAAIGMPRHAAEDLWPRFGTVALPSDTYVAMASGIPLALYRRQNDLAISRHDRLSRIAQTRVPLLLVAASEDPLCPPARQAALAAAVATAQAVVVPGAGHLLPLEQPQGLASRLATWLSGMNDELLCTGVRQDLPAPL